MIATLQYGGRIITQRHEPVAMLLPYNGGHATDERDSVFIRQLRRPGKVLKGLVNRPCVVTDDDGQPIGLLVKIDEKELNQHILHNFSQANSAAS